MNLLTILLVCFLVCALFAYIPLTLVVIHSRAGKFVADKYHDIKKRYWQTDYYGDSELSIEEFEKQIEREIS